jgi:hypothetical protein
MVKKTSLMKVDEDFRIMIENISKQNQISMRQATKEIAKTISLLKGNKKLKKKILEEISF